MTAAPAPQQRDRVWIDLLDQHGNLRGQLVPDVSKGPPKVQARVGRRIPRTLSGVRLPPDQLADIDPHSDRLRPMWRQDGVDWALGVFVWDSAARARHSWGVTLDGATLHDLTSALRQPLTASFGVGRGDRLDTAIIDLIEAAGFSSHDVATTTVTAGAPLAWPAGKDRADVIGELAGKLAYRSWPDRDGRLTVRQPPDPAVHAPDHWYDEDSAVGAPTETDDLWERPNTWLVISTSSSDQPIVATYELPATDPASITQRGFAVVDVVEEPGLSSTQQAQQRARQAALNAASTFEVELTTAPRPQHDLHHLVVWRGVAYREVGWALPLDPTATMTHRLVRRA